MSQTTIQIADETWQRLDDRKGRGESFDDVVRDLLDAQEATA
jgi:predicted CopG family antitoxin